VIDILTDTLKAVASGLWPLTPWLPLPPILAVVGCV